MTEGQSLLHAIRADPEEDTPRLIYADWLEEHASTENSNQARAEFIRLQCTAARMTPNDPELRGVQDRIAEFAPYRTPWLDALIQLGWVGWEELEFSRGFLSGLVVPVRHFDFDEVGMRFLWHEPVDRVTVGGPPELLVKAFSCPTAGLLSRCNIVMQNDAPVQAGAGDSVVETFANTRQRIPTDLFSAIPLRILALSDSGLTDRSANTLASSPTFGALRYLTIQGSFLTADGLRRLGEAAFAPHLLGLTIQGREWHYSASQHGREVARALGTGRFAELKYLRLKGYPLGNAGLIQLTKSPLAHQLSVLEVGQDMTILGKGLAALFDRQKWPRLEHLMLLPSGAGAAELDPLMSSDRFATLKNFGLYADGATSETAARLAANPHTARLEWLCFTGRNVGDDGVSALLRSPYMTQLRRLDVSGPDLSEELLMKMADPTLFPKLHTFTVSGARSVSPGTEAAIRGRFGDRFEFILYGT